MEAKKCIFTVKTSKMILNRERTVVEPEKDRMSVLEVVVMWSFIECSSRPSTLWSNEAFEVEGECWNDSVGLQPARRGMTGKD